MNPKILEHESVGKALTYMNIQPKGFSQAKNFAVVQIR